jgi:3-methylcrotonyl-CoA carboxylase alpha subunit
MNTRLQVEHPVTEAITGFDLVEWQLRVAAGEELPKRQSDIRAKGHAVEARLYAEDPQKGFLPSVGRLEHLSFPKEKDGLRIDTGVRQGDAVTVFYDPMIAKVIAWDETREAALTKLANALAHTEIAGIHTNAGFLVRTLRHPAFIAGDIDTGFIERHREALVPDHAIPAPNLFVETVLDLVSGRLAAERKAKIRSFDPWDAQDGFMLLGGAREIIEFMVDGKRVPVTITYVRGGALKIEVAGEQVSDIAERPVGIVRLSSGDIAVMKDGDTWLLSLYDPFAAAEAAGVASDRIVAPMSGKIVQLLVGPNAQVKRGQALAVLEAMKMEQTLSAPADAQVASVEVAAGEQVAEGAVILRFVVAQNAAS